MKGSADFCGLHRDRPAESAIGGFGYCASCRQEIAAAVRALPVGVVPRECFAVAASGGVWRTPAGSGAPHWLAHELLTRPTHASNRCAAGFAVRRADVLFGRRELVRELPRPRDLWVDLDAEGCGLVLKSVGAESGEIEISIRALIGSAGGVTVCDFYRDLHGRGHFFR